jgi:hypothetical protein
MLVCSKVMPHSVEKQRLPSGQSLTPHITGDAYGITLTAQRLEVGDTIASSGGKALDVILGRPAAIQLRIWNAAAHARAE